MNPPRAFLSHSHQDKPIARDLATKLRDRGVDVWVDEWEIMPGDSLVQKIFEEGVRNCSLFVVLLTRASTTSTWVKHELDSAIVQRLAGATRVVPVVGEPCDIPVSLRALLRLDLPVEGIDSVVARLVDVAFGRDRKPPLGPPPSNLDLKVSGLTNPAARIASLLSSTMDQPDGSPLGYSGSEISSQLSLNADQINDAVDELSALGLVRVTNFLGTAPYDFGHVEPTASLAFHLRGSGLMPYDPEEDVKSVAAAIVQSKNVDGSHLQETTTLSPSRINRAVSYLEDIGVVRVHKFMGTAPFDFGQVEATAATRRFVSKNS
ncbi:MAG: TIR domain-containing protein [Byssovorax sp.]